MCQRLDHAHWEAAGPILSLCVHDRKCLLSVCRPSARFVMDISDDIYWKKVSQGISLNTVSS